MGSIGIKTSEFFALFFAFAIVALSGLDITAGVIDYHLDLVAAMGALGASGVYGISRTALKHKTASADAKAAPTKEEVATEVLKQLQTPKESTQ